MSKLILIIILLIGVLITSNAQYIPLTDEEIEQYIKNIDISMLIKDIKKLDSLEHIKPILNKFQYTALILENGDLIIFPILDKIKLTYAYLSYTITLESFIIKDFSAKEIKKPRAGLFLCVGGAALGLITGIIIGRLIN